MNKIFTTTLLLLYTTTSFAGIETELLIENFGNCTIKIMHDATPDEKTGTITFRSYRPVNGIHERCSPAPSDVESAMKKAYGRYLKNKTLKPATSIFIRRLINYNWIKTLLENESNKPDQEKLTRSQFMKKVSSQEIIAPFQSALQSHGHSIHNASCEKLMYYPNGTPKDAICWLVIERQ